MSKNYLRDIGYRPDKIDLKRRIKFNKNFKETGAYPPDCWELNISALAYLYKNLVQYKKDASTIVDLTHYKFDYQGKEYTQIELIDKMIQIGEYILCNLNYVDKKSATYIRLINNPYRKKYGAYDHFSTPAGVEGEFWTIWSMIFPTMWW